MRFAAVLLATTLAATFSGPASATLPAPTEDAKAKAADAAAKSAWTDKVGAYQTCRADEHVADAYRRSLKAAGTDAPAPTPTPACVDPGPYVSAAPAPKPLEASGAHSPSETATAPPSSPATQQELAGGKKR